MSKRNYKSKVYQYLEKVDALDKGVDIIVQAKKQYYTSYKNNFIRQKRKSQKHFTIFFTQEEMQDINENITRLKFTSKTKFIKSAALAYCTQAYVIPNYLEIRMIRQHLAMTFNALQELLDQQTIELNLGKKIQQMIFELERQVLPILHNPKRLERSIIELLQKYPEEKSKLLDLIYSTI